MVQYGVPNEYMYYFVSESELWANVFLAETGILGFLKSMFGSINRRASINGLIEINGLIDENAIFEVAITSAFRRVERRDRRRSKAENLNFPTAPISSFNSSKRGSYGAFKIWSSPDPSINR